MDLLYHAKQMRAGQTPAEKLLWKYLRAHRFHGLKFKRQKPMGGYIVDFVCMEKYLIVELDGAHHLQQQEYDAERSKWFQAQGFRVLRFWNQEVSSDIDSVLAKIADLALFPSPSPAKRERGEVTAVTKPSPV